MQLYDHTIRTLCPGKTYTRNALLHLIQTINPSLSKNSLQWAVGNMVKSGKLVRRGYDEYALPSEADLLTYDPVYSDAARGLIEKISQKYPYIQFTVFETVLMNDFLNHLVAQNTIFIQVEKESSIFIFRFLQDQEYPNLMYKPTRKDFDLYWSKDVVVVTDLVSESPLSQSNPHHICIEKMLVDMYCDKLIRESYNKAEYESVMDQAISLYRIDRTKLMRYARRRNKGSEIARYLETNTQMEE